jgi:4-hydroxybenzoate polyprenyltransferase
VKETCSTSAPTGSGKGWVAGIHALYLYGAFGLASFGWAFCHKLGFNRGSTLLLWFAGALLIYNIDRLRPDRADSVNTPGRMACSGRLQHISLGLTLASALVLLLIPIFLGEWLLLILIIAGAVVCVGYSIQIFGLRFKDIPVVKTFFVPTLIAAAFLGVPLVKAQLHLFPVQLLLGLAWAWCILFFNMLLCDLRDMEGDRAAGTVSLPVYLGKRATHRLLLLVGVTIPLLAFLLVWPWQAFASIAYLSGLIFALRKPRPESFYEWWVEGLLFLPALVELMREFADFVK